MMTYEPLKSEKYLADKLKKENVQSRRQAAREEIAKVTTYFLTMAMIAGTIILYLTHEQWLPGLRELISQ